MNNAVRRFCTMERPNAGLTDEAIQLLLRAHGKVLLHRHQTVQDSSRNGPNIEKSNSNRVSVESILALCDKQMQEQQKEQQEKQQPKQKQEAPKGLDLAILLGSLKNVRGETFEVKKSERWEKIKQKVARRRPITPPLQDKTALENNTSITNGETTVEERTVKKIQLEVPSLDVECSVFNNAVKSSSSGRSKLSDFLDRLKNRTAVDNANTLDQDNGTSCSELAVVPTRRVWKAERYATSPNLIDQGTLNTIQALDLADDIQGSDVSAKTLMKLVRTFSYLDILSGSIEVLYAVKNVGFMPSATTYSLLICLLLKSGEHEKARSLLDELILEGTKLSEGVYITLIDSFERVGNLDTVYSLYQGMLHSNYTVNADTTERIFSVFLRAGRAQHAYNLLQHYGNSHNGIQVRTCNFLMDCLGKADKVNYAIHVFANMKGGELCTPDLTSYNILIKSLMKSYKIKEALKVFKSISRDRLTPDSMSYHYIISGLCRATKKKLAKKYFKAMKNHGFEPDALTYSCMINMYGKLGLINSALKLFEDMKIKNIPLDTMLFNSLLRAVGRSYKPSLAYNIFREMRYLEVNPDLFTYNLVFHALARRGRRKRATKVLREMRKDRIKPDVVTYTAFIHCLGNAGRFNSAHNMLHGMIRRGITPNIRTWNTLLNGIAKEDVIDLAFGVYKEMKSTGCIPDNTTYSILLDLSIGLRDSKRVLIIQRDYKESKLEPDVAMTKILQRSITYMRKHRITPFDPEVLLKP